MKTAIAELPAGDELDRMVAEYVMGARIVSDPANYRGWYEEYDPSLQPGNIKWRDVQHYSTNIAAAWSVAEKLRAMGFTINVWGEAKTRAWPVHFEPWSASFDPDRSGFNSATVEASSAPEAICRAALRALEQRSPSGSKTNGEG